MCDDWHQGTEGRLALLRQQRVAAGGQFVRHVVDGVGEGVQLANAVRVDMRVQVAVAHACGAPNDVLHWPDEAGAPGPAREQQQAERGNNGHADKCGRQLVPACQVAFQFRPALGNQSDQPLKRALEIAQDQPLVRRVQLLDTRTFAHLQRAGEQFVHLRLHQLVRLAHLIHRLRFARSRCEGGQLVEAKVDSIQCRPVLLQCGRFVN